MDTTTHALAGYLIVKTGLNRDTGRWGTIAGIAGSVFPDVDGILGIFLGTEFMIKYHRNLTNSIFLAVPFSVLFAWVSVRLSGTKRFWSFFLIVLVEVLAHTFMDLITSYGTMILSPLSKSRFSLDWVFIIDPYFSLTLLFSIIALFICKKKATLIARISLILVALYICLCAYNHSWALNLAKRYAAEKALDAQRVASLPQPLSPFFWGNYILTERRVHAGFVNLIGDRERVRRSDGGFLGRFFSRYQPIRLIQYRSWDRLDDSVWVQRALKLEGVRTFLWFARFPVARYKGVIDGKNRVEFFDLRFGLLAARRPFLYGVDFDQEGTVVFQGFLSQSFGR
jgi:inner membrane protein